MASFLLGFCFGVCVGISIGIGTYIGGAILALLIGVLADMSQTSRKNERSALTEKMRETLQLLDKSVRGAADAETRAVADATNPFSE